MAEPNLGAIWSFKIHEVWGDIGIPLFRWFADMKMPLSVVASGAGRSRIKPSSGYDTSFIDVY